VSPPRLVERAVESVPEAFCAPQAKDSRLAAREKDSILDHRNMAMLQRSVLLLLFGSMLAACASSTKAPDDSYLSPETAVIKAAEAAPNGFHGSFVFEIKGVGSSGGLTYLNSQRDYRDQRSLNVALSPFAAVAFADEIGAVDEGLIGKTVRVTGEARQTRIFLQCDGQPTSVYYYQTQLFVSDLSQIELISAPQ
jgi:hypothetical protein